MTNVIAMPGVTPDFPPPTEPNPDLIKKIEELLVGAKSGEYTSMAYTVVGSDGIAAGTDWSIAAGQWHTVAASIGDLFHQFYALRFANAITEEINSQ